MGDLSDDLALFGLPADAFEEVAEIDDRFHVLDENWDSVMVFLGCSTQWRRELPGMADQWYWHGLRYTECLAVIKGMGFRGKRSHEIFQDLQVMEGAALPVLNKSKKKR